MKSGRKYLAVLACICSISFAQQGYTPKTDSLHGKATTAFPEYEKFKRWIIELVEVAQSVEDFITPTKALSMAKRATGLAMLRNVYTAEMMMFAEQEKFESDFDKLGLSSRYCDYKISIITDGRSLTVRASANIDKDDFEDILEVNEDGQFRIIQDDIKNEIVGTARPIKSGGYKP